MNFTREPIILSVITPKEGCKLVLRNTHIEEQEDYFVDAIEVVSFEGAIFYRSLERPKSFVVPVHSYEVLEVKETRMVLKGMPHEKAIKIGGGARQMPQQQQPQGQPQGEEKKGDKMRERKRSKRRKPPSSPSNMPEPSKPDQGGDVEIDETPQVSSSVLKKIFPPPNTLIKEKLARYKNEEFFEENILPLVDEQNGKSSNVIEEPSVDADAFLDRKEEAAPHYNEENPDVTRYDMGVDEEDLSKKKPTDRDFGAEEE